MPSLPPRHAPDIDQDRLLAETSLVSIERHRVLGSTNDRAKSLAREGKGNLPALILADHQTAGRGRGANRWWTGPGSLAFTLLADTENWQIPPERIPLVALVAGIALVETVEPRLTGATACLPEDSDQRLRAGLHWPNDVYLGDRKLAGILVEMPRADRLVVGVGLNTNCRVAEAPKELRDRVATLLDVTEQVHDHTSLLIDWLALEKWSEENGSGVCHLTRKTSVNAPMRYASNMACCCECASDRTSMKADASELRQAARSDSKPSQESASSTRAGLNDMLNVATRPNGSPLLHPSPQSPSPRSPQPVFPVCAA